MGVGEPHKDQAAAQAVWLYTKEQAVRSAWLLVRLDVDKSRVNRLLEPFMWHTALVTATDWSNFFALRTSESAQPEFRRLAIMMQEAYQANEPWYCPEGKWHLPLVSLEELGPEPDYEYWKKVCAGRCARVSYLTHDGKRDPAADVGLHNRLLASGHMSPFEHAATAFSDAHWAMILDEQATLRSLYESQFPRESVKLSRLLEYSGNFCGWSSYRSQIPNEHDFSRASAA